MRKRVIQAIEVDGLVRRSVGRIGIPARGFIPPGLLGYESGKPPVPSAGKDSALKGIELSWMINPTYESSHLPFSRELIETLRKTGLEIKVIPTIEEEMNKRIQAAASDILLERWIADYPDTDNFVALLHSEKGFYRNYCGTPEIDRLIERGRAETRPEVRHDIYREIEHIIARRALLLPLFHAQTYRLARPEVEGYEVRFSYPAIPYEKLWIRR